MCPFMPFAYDYQRSNHVFSGPDVESWCAYSVPEVYSLKRALHSLSANYMNGSLIHLDGHLR